MLFSSGEFVLLVSITFCLYYLPVLASLQVPILIAASLTFYAFARLDMVLLLVFTGLTDFVVSYGMFRSPVRSLRVAIAALGVALNISLLIFFKYTGLLISTFLTDTSVSNQWTIFVATLPLPIGISFFTLQGISILVDQLRGDLNLHFLEDTERPLRDYCLRTTLTVFFFPKLFAGPIVRARHFFPQVETKLIWEIDWEFTAKTLIMGYFLKMVIADNLQDHTFWMDYPYFMHFGSYPLAVMLLGFSVQLFADFAGYSLIAIGVASLFGYRLPENFNYPYISRSFMELWRRWHISFTSWLRDYLYFPLGGSRKGPVRTFANTLVVMILSGLWHGAAWSFALWGALHGLILAMERPLRSRIENSNSALLSLLSWFVVFILLTYLWIFLRLPKIGHIIEYTKYLFKGTGPLATDPRITICIWLYTIPVMLYHLIYLWRERIVSRSQVWKDYAYAVMLFGIITGSGSPVKFFYFQF
ncbi:MAG TPA: MBOAT family O-acyltransferase [Desulfomonilaceae bacterium]|nr:MBOAT family O-acyltransferase [Desulfomonilaceae bacterium]